MRVLSGIRMQMSLLPAACTGLYRDFRDRSLHPWQKIAALLTAIRRLLLLYDTWLSTRVPTLREVRRRAVYWRNAGFAERFRRLLHRLHSFAASALLAGCVVTGVLLFAIIYGSVDAGNANNPVGEGPTATIATLAAVIGAVAGLLFAAVIFAIQFHGERLGDAAFLTRYLARQEGIIPIAALTLAVVAIDALGALIAATWLPSSAWALAWANLVLIPLVLVLVLWLLVRMVNVVAGDFLEDCLLPTLSWEFNRTLDHEVHEAMMIEEFEGQLAANGMKRYYGSALWGGASNREVRFYTRSSGLIVDLNVCVLEQLAALVGKQCPNLMGEIAVVPGDTLRGRACFILTHPNPKRDGSSDPVLVTPNPAARTAIQLLVDRLYYTSRPRTEELLRVLGQLVDTLVAQARHATAEHLRRSLAVQEGFVKLRLERSAEKSPEQTMFSKRLPVYLDYFEYADMARESVLSGDWNKVEEVLRFSIRVMCLAIEHGNSKPFVQASQMAELIYLMSNDHKELQEPVSGRFDGDLFTVLERFRLRSTDDRKLRAAAGNFPVLIRGFAWTLDLIHIALDQRRDQDVRHFHDRLADCEDEDSLRRYGPNCDEITPPELLAVADLHSFSNILLAAWCLHCVGGAGNPNPIAIETFQNAVSHLRTPEDVLRIWEWAHNSGNGRASLRDQFGVRRWLDHKRHYRVGKIYSSAGDRDHWVDGALVPILLAVQIRMKRDWRRHVFWEPELMPVTTTGFRQAAEQRLCDEWFAETILKVTESEKQRVVDGVSTVLAKAECVLRLRKLRKVIEIPLSANKIDRFDSTLRDKLTNCRDVARAIMELGSVQPHSDGKIAVPVVVKYRPWKEWFLEDDSESLFAPEDMARSLGFREGIAITAAAEQSAKSSEEIGSLRTLRGAVERAVIRLKESGYSPSMLLIPNENRVVRALTGQPRRKLRMAGRRSQYELGEWNGLRLIAFPYVDPHSLVVVDATEFYCGGPDAELAVAVEDCERGEHLKMLADAESETDPDRIPEPSDVSVSVIARLTPSLRVRSPDAALRIDLDLTRLGYAMLEDDQLYHRPSCETLDPEKRIHFGLIPKLGSDQALRQACEQCKPAQWEEDEVETEVTE